MKNLSGKRIKALIVLAETETWTDNPHFDACSYSGGNYDDTYYGGVSDGETALARVLLTELGIKYNIPKVD